MLDLRNPSESVGNHAAAPAPNVGQAPPRLPVSAQEAEVSPQAKLGVIFMCLSFVLGIFAGIPAIIFGHMGLKEIRHSSGAMRGTKRAVFSIVVGYASCAMSLFLPLILAIAIPQISKIGEKAQEASDQRNAQNFVAVHSAALAAGADFSIPEGDSSVVIDSLVQQLVTGVTGSGTFADSVFNILPWDPESSAQIKQYIHFDPLTGYLSYDRFDSLSDHVLPSSSSVPLDPHALMEDERNAKGEADWKRSAHRIAETHAAATAAGVNFQYTGQFTRDPIDAIVNQLEVGVNGTGRYARNLFQIPPLTTEETEKAKKYLTFDSSTGLLHRGKPMDADELVKLQQAIALREEQMIQVLAAQSPDFVRAEFATIFERARDIVAVHGAAMACGATFHLKEEDKTPALTIVHHLQTGVSGTHQFADQIFQIPTMSPVEMSSLRYVLDYDPETRLLSYREPVAQTQTSPGSR